MIRAFMLVSGLALVASSVMAQPDPGHYDSADDSSPQALRDSLHAIIEDHTRFPYTSSQTDTWDVLEIADEDQDNSAAVTTIYRNASFPKQGGGNDFYNREHTWPRSYGFPDNDENLNYPFTDMHHLLLADSNYNFQRSNKPYDDCDAGCTEWPTEANDGRGGAGGGYPGDSNWTDGDFTQGRWEVWQGRRGDIARAMFYMDVRYEGGTHGITGASEPDLILTDDVNLIDQGNTGQNEAVAHMGYLDTLLQWHIEDPVDAVEMQHHETVAAFQGNRNPFIDHPEWVDCLFVGVCGVVINAGMNDAWLDFATAGQGFFFVVYPELGKVFVAMFTFDSERPPDDIVAIFGAPDQRWVTAFGDYSGNRAELGVELTSGGIFNSALPAVDQQQGYGTFVIEFSGCNSGTVTYDFPGLDLSGVIPITRLTGDNVPLCEALNREIQQQP